MKIDFKESVVSLLKHGETSGRNIRHMLCVIGLRMSGPRFYLNMAKLEEEKIVQGWYREIKFDGLTECKERMFKLL